MNIDLLSKMVKDLILDKDEVSLPGVGTFVAEMVPASFSDRGYTINPPYRRLSFRQRTDGTDMSLVELYAASNGVDREQALRILTDFLAEMKEVLKTKKTIIFPELGRLRATRENNFFFVADGDLDIWPGGYGLEPISLKTHQETPEEVSSVVEGLRSMIAAPAAEAPAIATPAESVEEAPVVETPEAPAEPVVSAAAEPTIETPTETVEEAQVVEAPVLEAPAETVVEAPVVETPEAPAEPVDSAATEPVVTAATEAAKKPKKAGKIALYVGLGLLAAALLALLLFVILAHAAPDFIDTLLYSPEERELLRSL